MRILVAEDSPTEQLLLRGLLVRYGSVDVVEDGQAAVEAFTRALTGGRQYHLLCLDILMPKFDGNTALAHIRNVEEHSPWEASPVKVIMTTMLRDLATIMDAFSNGCDSYIIKPVSGGELKLKLLTLGLI